MSKKIFALTLFLFSCMNSKAQGLYNNTLCFGDSVMLRYNNGSFDSNIPSAMKTLEACASISDSIGNLLFYTDGIRIWNRNNFQMPNADSLEGGPILPLECGSTATQGALILPFPNHPNNYFVFYLKYFPPAGLNKLSFARVDMNADNTLGDVIAKNQLLVNDSLSERMCAVKHGNGRDWWIYVHHSHQNIFIRFLLTPNGIEGPFYQTIGNTWFNDDTIGSISISNDGSKLGCCGKLIEVFSLDRCTGNLFDAETICHNNNGIYGCAFSPSNLYLYYSTIDSLFQIDLSIETSCDNRFLVYYDSLISNPVNGIYPIGMFQLLNLNGKIIISNGTGTTSLNHLPPYNTSLSIINNPNGSGANCQFSPFSIPLQKGTILCGLPNLPNYNLSALDMSACDTLNLSIQNENLKTKNSVSIYPNPASNELAVSSSQLAINTIEITDALGRKIYSEKINLKSKIINLKSFSPGVYFIKLQMQNGEMQVMKFVKE